ncbi:MAG: hypothetical protein R3F25_12930 [Gammaproteobacteria bacterium]
MELDLKLIAKLMLSFKRIHRNNSQNFTGMAVSEVSSPLISKEIFYRLLISNQGSLLRQIVSTESKSYRIVQALDWLRNNFNKTLRVNELANRVGLSVSAFYKHFNAITAMSPIQYQKKIRLNEARQLMLAKGLTASEAWI